MIVVKESNNVKTNILNPLTQHIRMRLGLFGFSTKS